MFWAPKNTSKVKEILEKLHTKQNKCVWSAILLTGQVSMYWMKNMHAINIPQAWEFDHEMSTK